MKWIQKQKIITKKKKKITETEKQKTYSHTQFRKEH